MFPNLFDFDEGHSSALERGREREREKKDVPLYLALPLHLKEDFSLNQKLWDLLD